MGIHTEGRTSDITSAVSDLHARLMRAWNERKATDFADQFADDGSQVGFDGSEVNGRAEIERHLSQIFADHTPATYVWKVREVRQLTPGAALLRAVVGMVPPGKSELNPATNAIQCLVAVQRDDAWRIAHFQNTPAQFHGRPEAVEQLTSELSEQL